MPSANVYRSVSLHWRSRSLSGCRHGGPNIFQKGSSAARLQWQQQQVTPMQIESLTFKELRARPVVLKLQRPVIARISTITEWPLILIDLFTEEGIVGRSYLEPYIVKSMRYLLPALQDLGEMLKGRRVVPLEFYTAARKSLHFVGYEGLAMIAASGLDNGGLGHAREGGEAAALRTTRRLGGPGEILQ